MKKSTWLLSVLLLFCLACMGLNIHADQVYGAEAHNETFLTTTDTAKEADLYFDILGYGEFDNPLNLDQYDYSLNQLGFSTGKVVLTYSAKALTDITVDKDIYFNLKLPTEFKKLHQMKENLKPSIMASFKLPEDAGFKNISSEDISTENEGMIDFHLNAKEPVKADQPITVKVSIDYGKMLDDLNLGASYDYQTIIPNAEGSYEFRGMLTSNKHLLSFPEKAATGLTEGNSACKSLIPQK